jgi:DNA-binding response OmpR family regulator
VQEEKKNTVLVVDDQAANLGVLFEHLNQAGFRVLVAEDGASALERARLAPPDIILLEVMLPDMDGLAVCRRLKEDQSTRDIPIIFLTASDEIVNKVRGFEMRAAD